VADGIKFLIDLDSRTAGANAADTALGRVEASADRADGHLKSMGHHAEGLSRDVFKADFAMEVLKKSAELAWEGVHKVAELIKDTVTEVADERREKMAMTNLLGGEEDAEKAIHYLDRFSEASEFGEARTKAMGIELLNAGYRGQEWQNALAGIADAASMSSDKMAGAEGALSSFMRMKETGKLDARILRRLHLNVKDVVKGLGDSLGMTPSAVKKGLLEGSIPAAKAYETVLRAIEKKTGKSLGEAGLTAGKGLEAKLTHLKELPEKIMKSVSDSPGMEKIEHGFDKLLESFDPDSTGGKKMISGLSSLMGSVGDLVEGTDWDAVATHVGDIASSIGKWVDPLAKAVGLVGKLAEGILGLPTFGEDVGDWVARKLHPELNQTPTHVLEARARRQAEFDATNAAEWRDVDLARGKGEGKAGAAGGTHIEGKAEVTVHVHGSKASAEDIGHAAKKGVEAGLTTALEQQALHAGTRSARKR
jgi:tape measure domain-containing protein